MPPAWKNWMFMAGAVLFTILMLLASAGAGLFGFGALLLGQSLGLFAIGIGVSGLALTVFFVVRVIVPFARLLRGAD